MPNHEIQLSMKIPNEPPSPDDVETLVQAMSQWYVRMDGKYYDALDPRTKFSRDDIQAASIARFQRDFPEIVLSVELLREEFKSVFTEMHFVEGIGIPTWSGSSQCLPGNPDRFIRTRGMVTINSWTAPPYRSLDDGTADPGTVGDFFDAVFECVEERETYLDWLAWCLQNEGEKPTWAPLLYSKSKGTGKSTLCDISRHLFGRDNSITQNGVEKLTGRFSMPLLLSKFIVSEELDIKQGTRAANALKTFMTETDTAGEVTLNRPGFTGDC